MAVVVHVIKHSPVWLLPLLTADIIDVVVQHRPVAQLGWKTLQTPSFMTAGRLTHSFFILYFR